MKEPQVTTFKEFYVKIVMLVHVQKTTVEVSSDLFFLSLCSLSPEATVNSYSSWREVGGGGYKHNCIDLFLYMKYTICSESCCFHSIYLETFEI